MKLIAMALVLGITGSVSAAAKQQLPNGGGPLARLRNATLGKKVVTALDGSRVRTDTYRALGSKLQLRKTEVVGTDGAGNSFSNVRKYAAAPAARPTTREGLAAITRLRKMTGLVVDPANPTPLLVVDRADQMRQTVTTKNESIRRTRYGFSDGAVEVVSRTPNGGPESLQTRLTKTVK